MTPEEIVGLIGNIANRKDIRDAHAQQIKEIKALVEAERKACSEIASGMADAYYKSGIEQAGIACNNVSWYIDQRGKNEVPTGQSGN